jgi:hypothetical protein
MQAVRVRIREVVAHPSTLVFLATPSAHWHCSVGARHGWYVVFQLVEVPS